MLIDFYFECLTTTFANWVGYAASNGEMITL